MSDEQYPEKPANRSDTQPSDDFFAQLAQVVNDGAFRQEIDEATGYDPDLEV